MRGRSFSKRERMSNRRCLQSCGQDLNLGQFKFFRRKCSCNRDSRDSDIFNSELLPVRGDRDSGAEDWHDVCLQLSMEARLIALSRQYWATRKAECCIFPIIEFVHTVLTTRFLAMTFKAVEWKIRNYRQLDIQVVSYFYCCWFCWRGCFGDISCPIT